MYNHTHTHRMEYYSAIRKEWNLATRDSKTGPIGYYAKHNEPEKDNTVWFLVCVEPKQQNKWDTDRTKQNRYRD